VAAARPPGPPVQSGDQTYPAWALDNVFRRWFAPPRRTVNRLDPQPGERVVDLGAGVGYYANETLARLGPSGHLTLVDINGAALARFRSRHGPDQRVDLVVGSAASVPQVAAASEDRVLLADVLCDVEDKAGILAEAYRMLRPGGTVYVSFHSVPQPDPRRPLRPTPAVWDAARRQNPWEERARGGKPTHPWYLLVKPATQGP